MSKITLQDVKQALLDQRFREVLPSSLNEDVNKFLSNPGCMCNHSIYKKVMKTASQQLLEYFPNKNISKEDVEEESKKISVNEWSVINCHIDELSKKLKQLPPGRVQLDVARYQDQVTVVVNHLDIN